MRCDYLLLVHLHYDYFLLVYETKRRSGWGFDEHVRHCLAICITSGNEALISLCVLCVCYVI